MAGQKNQDIEDVEQHPINSDLKYNDDYDILEDAEVKQCVEERALDDAQNAIHAGRLKSAVAVTSLAYKNINTQEFVVVEIGEDGNPEDVASIIPVLDESGQDQPYTATRLQTENPGLVPWLLLPQEVESSAENIDIHLTFRGTNSAAGLKRDFFEIGGAGNKSYWKENQSILEQLNKEIGEFLERKDVQEALRQGKKINFIFSGHSLGGADAQVSLVCLLQDLMAENTNPALKKLRNNLKIRLAVRNSAGIKQEFADSAKRMVESNFKNIDFQIYFAANHNDPVQQTGEADLLHVFNHSPNALAVYMKFYPLAELSGFQYFWALLTLKAHSAKPILHKPIFEQKVVILTNETPEGRGGR